MLSEKSAFTSPVVTFVNQYHYNLIQKVLWWVPGMSCSKVGHLDSESYILPP